METLTYDTYAIIDEMERQYHVPKVFVDTRFMKPYKRKEYQLLCQDQKDLLNGNDSHKAMICIIRE